MSKENKFIFDLDGTLYTFDRGNGSSFSNSKFYADIRANACSFIMDERKVDSEEAESEYRRIKNLYKGEVSLGVEREYGINRDVYFENTWNLDPEQYIEKNPELPSQLAQIKRRIALLTAAPRIWALNVLAYLDIESAFEGNIYTGEPDVRKPNPKIFQKIVSDLRTIPEKVFSIGDQEETDILPAKKIGMKTVLIGNNVQSQVDLQAPNINTALQLLKGGNYL